jgi:predicted ester cyclase
VVSASSNKTHYQNSRRFFEAKRIIPARRVQGGGGLMRNGRVLWLMLLLCGGLTLTSAAQKKGGQQPQVRERPGQVSPQQNKLVARRVFEELTNQGRYEAVDEVFDRNCKVHFGNRTLGLSQAVAEGKGWKSAAPDLAMNVEQVTENGDRVTVVWSARGTHTGQGLGTKPTRKQISMRDRSEFLIKNGKIVEAWNNEYRPELFRQLGVNKAGISMFDTTERLWAALAQMLPDPLYASLR